MKVQLLTHAPSQHGCGHCKKRRQPANSPVPAAERPQAASGSDEATRLIQDATAQAERIKNEARVAARDEAQTITQNARAEALRIQDEARAEAQTITQTARGNAQRIENEAQAQARRILQDAHAQAAQAQAAPAGGAAPMTAPLSGPFVAIFFQGGLGHTRVEAFCFVALPLLASAATTTTTTTTDTDARRRRRSQRGFQTTQPTT